MRTTVESEAPVTHQAAESVLADLAGAVGSLRCVASQRLVRLGISMTHFHVLTLLRHNEAMPMGRLADILDASMSSATGIIDRMEEKGLVERVRVPDDRRIVLVRPTKAGLDLVDDVELVKNEVMIRALARLDADQLERVAAAVSDIGTAVNAEIASDPARFADVHPHPHAHASAHAHARSAQPAQPAQPADTAQPAP
jgi:DNA-binding MarR family transcriptional regulator